MRAFWFAIFAIRGACCLIWIKKRCLRCRRSMVKFGHTPARKQRWRCMQCATTGIRLRPDTARRHRIQRFRQWLISTMSAATIATKVGITLRGFRKRYRIYWDTEPRSPRWITPSTIVVLDGTSLLPRQCVALIAYGLGCYPQMSWVFAERETAAAWSIILARTPPPQFVVCDGQKGLLRAIRMHWPNTTIQRCLIHVVRQSVAWITQRPQTRAGQQLLEIVRALPGVRTRRQKRRWLRKFRKWSRYYVRFLNARTAHPIDAKRWWYTHRKLRRARTLIERSLPHLFTYVRHPHVPRTSNHVEGGINARLHELFRAHRGLSLARKRVLTAYFLLSKLKQKSTRKFH